MAGLTTSSTLSGQFRNYFSKELLNYAVQLTKLDQFAKKAPVPRKAGAKGITMFRWGAPSIADMQALTEGTTPSIPSTSQQLALTSISKSLAQYGHSITVTDIMKMTELFNSVAQSTKVTGQNLALWYDSVIRNVMVGSNLTISGSNVGTAVENGGSGLDNSDTITEVYGSPASGLTQTFAGLNTSTTASEVSVGAAVLLDLATKLKKNRAPEVSGGGYVFVTDPAISRDLQRDSDWLNASNYGNAGKPFYKGEVGSIAGMRVVEQTNSFISKGSATVGDRYIYDSSGGNGTASGKNIYASFAMGAEAVGVPELDGQSGAAPSIDVLDSADKSDPFNQRIVIATKAYFAALRLNCNWYIVHRAKTSYAL